MKRKALPLGAIILILMVALAAIGLSYSLWSETLTISGTVHTGEVDVEFSTYPPQECVDIWDVGECLPEPQEKAEIANCTVEWLGPDQDSEGDEGYDELVVTVNGMYPSWHCKVQFDVTSTGSVPVHVRWPEPTGDIPEWIATDFEACYPEGVQLHQGQSTDPCTIDIHFTNEQAPPEGSGPYTFGWTILAEQWNEAPVPGPVVNPGTPDWTKAAGVRYKGYNTGGEFYLGVDLGVGYPSRVEAEYNDFGAAGQKTYQVTFAYDQAANALSASITSPDQALAYDFDDLLAPGCSSTGWDAMEILVRDSRTDSGAALENVMLDSVDLGDLGTVDKAGTPGWQNWTVTGFDFSQDFQMTADLVVDGFTGNESIKVEFNVGCLN